MRTQMSGKLSRWCALLIATAAAASANAKDTSAALPKQSIPTLSVANVARTGFFYVGGKYAGQPGKETMHGAMYVEVMVPKKVRHATPVVFFHGVGQTAAGWLQTPDGRPGWAHDFLQRGYVVYLLDLPGRGRSAFLPEVDGMLNARSAAELSPMWTASAELGGWPQAKLHSQWPGAGKQGDAVFDNFARTQVQFPPSGLEQLVVDAGIDLLDKIGTPVVLLTHSQGGLFGWSIADARPDKVAAIVTVEPAGPPLKGIDFNKVTYVDRPSVRWGVTNLPIRYEPAVSDPAGLQVELESQAAAAGEVPCYVQAGTPRRLQNLARIPVLFAVGEASYHRVFDRCTAKWLQQAGVPTDYVELQDQGLRGNGHMMMLEKNSSDIAAYFAKWLDEKLK